MDIADAFDTKIYISTLTSLTAVETVLKVRQTPLVTIQPIDTCL